MASHSYNRLKKLHALRGSVLLHEDALSEVPLALYRTPCGGIAILQNFGPDRDSDRSTEEVILDPDEARRLADLVNDHIRHISATLPADPCAVVVTTT